jgi:transcriptional regulator with XRE-family HTH domain
MIRIPGPDTPRLLSESQVALGLTQEKLGDLLTASRRTVSRWASGTSRPSVDQLQTLARAVYPEDASLAAKVAAEGGQTLEGLGLVRPEPAPPPAPPAPLPRPFPPTRLVAESVVCAAAEAMQAAPAVMREVLRAAFARAQALGLSLEEMNEALSPPAEAAPAKAATRGKRAGGG